MRNDRKGAPAGNLVGQGTHQWASAVAADAGRSPVSGPAAPALAIDMIGTRRFANWHRISE
jgi:hypothetical protein